jgi:hypothetical protein
MITRSILPCLLATTLAVAALPIAAHAQAAAAEQDGATAKAYDLGYKNESITATVTGIDKSERFVTLRGPKGKEVTIEAGPDVKNFDQLKVGDQVTATYQSAAALEILPADSGAPSVETSEGSSAAPKGAKPGIEGQQSVTVTSKLTAIDMTKHTVTLLGPDGKSRVVTVRDPARQAKMSGLKVGQLVRITYVEAVAVKVTPKGAKD